MPLTQLTSLREELRQCRFRQLSVALLLEPFPRLRADLLDAWFEDVAGSSSQGGSFKHLQTSQRAETFKRKGVLANKNSSGRY